MKKPFKVKSIEQIRKEKPKLYKAENNLELHNNFRG